MARQALGMREVAGGRVWWSALGLYLPVPWELQLDRADCSGRPGKLKEASKYARPGDGDLGLTDPNDRRPSRLCIQPLFHPGAHERRVSHTPLLRDLTQLLGRPRIQPYCHLCTQRLAARDGRRGHFLPKLIVVRVLLELCGQLGFL